MNGDLPARLRAHVAARLGYPVQQVGVLCGENLCIIRVGSALPGLTTTDTRGRVWEAAAEVLGLPTPFIDVLINLSDPTST